MKRLLFLAIMCAGIACAATNTVTVVDDGDTPIDINTLYLVEERVDAQPLDLEFWAKVTDAAIESKAQHTIIRYRYRDRLKAVTISGDEEEARAILSEIKEDLKKMGFKL